MKQENKNQRVNQPSIILFKGVSEDAEYCSQIIEEFRDNPLLEALPEILSPEEVAQALSHSPDYSPKHRELAIQHRLLKLENAREFFIPMSRDIELYYCLMNMLRRGYIHRNPINSNYYSGLNHRIDSLNKEMSKQSSSISFRSRARGATICGTGGTGKSTSIENNLLLLPQVIIHKSYKGQDLILKQLVWLKMDCPQDGSVRGLCLAFFTAVDEVLGTSYLSRYNTRSTINDLLLYMARVAAIHCLGVIIIDEIQDLSEAKSGGQTHLMNFFVHLENSIGVPFVLIGTPKALPLFKGEFRQARRASEQGDFLWKRMQMLADEDTTNPNLQPQPDPVWNEFVRIMWQYQYVKKFKILPENILDEPVTKILYNESQGIIAVALTIFVLTQKRAIMSKVEEITSDVMMSAVRDNQNLISKMIDSIKLGQKIRFHGEADFEPPEFRDSVLSQLVIDKMALANIEKNREKKNSSDSIKSNTNSTEDTPKQNKRIKNGKNENKNGNKKSKNKKDSLNVLNSTGIEQYLKLPTELI